MLTERSTPFTMTKKRKSDSTRLDEVDRTIYPTFRSAANSLSQLYTQAVNYQRLSFQAGERHALEKLYQWILRQQEEGCRVTTMDIVAYMQNELDYSVVDPTLSPRPTAQHHQHAHPQPNACNPSPQATAAAHRIRPGLSDQQAKNFVFSNALSSPVRRGLQNVQSGYQLNNNVSREVNSSSSNDSMEMHADSPSHDSHF